MPSLYARMMNLVFRCMPQGKPGQPHDYAAERKRNNRRPPRPPKSVIVRRADSGWRWAVSHRHLRPRRGERLQSGYDHAEKPCH